MTRLLHVWASLTRNSGYCNLVPTTPALHLKLTHLKTTTDKQKGIMNVTRTAFANQNMQVNKRNLIIKTPDVYCVEDSKQVEGVLQFSISAQKHACQPICICKRDPNEQRGRQILF